MPGPPRAGIGPLSCALVATAAQAWFDLQMNHTSPDPTIVRAERIITAPADRVFELIADPARQPRWDGNDNLSEAEPGQRVRAVGTMFTTTITKGALRHNHVVEFDEGRLIAWQPSEPDQ